MSVHLPSPFLRRVLLVDAATCVLTGAAFITVAELLAQAFHIPAALLQPIGILLLVFGAAVAFTGTRQELHRGAVWVILGLNFLWAAESVLALAFGWLDPNTLGRAFVISQAIAVAVIAELQFIGLRRAGRTLAR